MKSVSEESSREDSVVKRKSERIKSAVNKRGAFLAHTPVCLDDLRPERAFGPPEEWDKSTTFGAIRVYVYWCVQSKYFDGFMVLAVFMNVTSIAVESEMYVTSEPNSDVFRVLDFCFLGIFSVELALRLFVYKGHALKGFANLLDVFIVVAGWLTEVVFPLLGSASQDTKVMSSLKVGRLLRCVRIVRMVTFFEDLWLIVHSFYLCLRPLFWVVVFISIVIFMFANFATAMIGQQADFAHLYERIYFVSVLPSMMSLFMIMTLDGWNDVVQPFWEEQAWTYPFFLLYICISALALLNLVTAVVVETSVKKTQEDAEYQRQLFDAAVQADIAKIRDLFREVDHTGGGSVTKAEFAFLGVKS